MWKTDLQVSLSGEERVKLEAMSRAYSGSHGEVVRARIVLLLAAGTAVSAIAREVKVGRRIVHKWGERFQTQRLSGLADKSGRGRKAYFSPGSCASLDQARVRAA